MIKNRLNNVKCLVIGLTLGLLVTNTTAIQDTITQIIAVPVTYPVLVNDKPIKSDVLNVSGKTYVPIRDVAESMNANVNWNKELNRVEIVSRVGESDKVVETISTPMVTPTPIVTKESTPTKLDPNIIPDNMKITTNINDLSYEHFKANFIESEKVVAPSSDKLISVMLTYRGNLNIDEFYSWFNALDKESYLKKWGREIQQVNPTFILSLLVKYTNYANNQLTRLNIGNILIEPDTSKDIVIKLVERESKVDQIIAK